MTGITMMTSVCHALLNLVTLYVTRPIFASINSLPEIREYCLTEYFNASCSRPSDVILMTSAVYGRMRLGRCIRGDYNLGCSNDVISLFDAQCSGRRSCDVSVRTLVDIRPCQRDFASYLEASYICITVLDLHVTSCPSSDGVTIATGASPGYVSNTLYDAYSSLGWYSCPWVIRASPGQRIQLTLLTLQAPRLSTGADPASTDDCSRIVVVDSGNDDKTRDYDDESQHKTHAFSLCVKNERERLLYTSTSHYVSVYTVTSSSLTNHNRRHSQARFLLVYKVIGCPQLVLSERAWVKSVGSHGDDIMVRCNDTLETWYLSCQGNQWIGYYDNCTTTPPVHLGSDVRPPGLPARQHHFTHGIMMALLLGLTLGVLIAVVALCTVCCVQYWCRRRPTGKAMAELAASVGHQLINVDYDNNKHDFNNDNSVLSSSVRRINHDPGGNSGGGDPSCLLDLNPNDFPSQDGPPVRLGVSVSGVDTPRTLSEDSNHLTVMSCDTTSNTPCARCGLQLHHHHHHHHHPWHHQLPQQQALVYGQLCTDGSFSDDTYPVGLRTPQ